jgi:hypothetical protein
MSHRSRSHTVTRVVSLYIECIECANIECANQNSHGPFLSIAVGGECGSCTFNPLVES